MNAQKARWRWVYAALALALVAAGLLSVAVGSVPIPLGDVARSLLGRGADATQAGILWKIRLPRALMAALLGGALSLSGFLLQTFFGNPIAGPFVLGISSGAKLVVALVMIFFLRIAGGASSWALIGAAFAGSLLATGRCWWRASWWAISAPPARISSSPSPRTPTSRTCTAGARAASPA